MSVREAVERDLEALPADLREGSLAATALALAVELDGHSSATSKSMCAKALLEIMNRLRELSPPAEKKGELHDLKSRRALRLAEGSSGS